MRKSLLTRLAGWLCAIGARPGNCRKRRLAACGCGIVWLCSCGVIQAAQTTKTSYDPHATTQTVRQHTYSRGYYPTRVSKLRWQPMQAAQAEVSASVTPPNQRLSQRCAQNQLCDGAFIHQPLEWYADTQNNLPVGFNTEIFAEKQAYLQQHGRSLLIGNVKILKPDKNLLAQRVQFQLSEQRDRIVEADLQQDLSYADASGMLIIADAGHFNFQTKSYDLLDGYYRLPIHFASGTQDLWGYATAAHNAEPEPEILYLTKASYTTCAPWNTAWYIYGDEVILDKEHGECTVKQATLYLRNIPVLYLPKLTFMFKQRRRSGWLMPTPKYSNAAGLSIDAPYYFNLAPNYDLTVTPKFYSKRGLLFNGDFRYLSATSYGNLWVSWIPKDREFATFNRQLPVIRLGGRRQRGRETLDIGKTNSHGSRYALSVRNRTQINNHWHGDVDLNYASDHYFIRDFGPLPNNYDNKDQLLNQATAYYSSLHYGFSARVQCFQTMNTIYNTGLSKQYRRVPELRFTADWPERLLGNGLAVNSEFVYFQHDDAQRHPVGSRIAISPTLYRDLQLADWSIHAKLQLYSVYYDLNDPAQLPMRRQGSQSAATHNFKSQLARAVPVFSLESKQYLQRPLRWGGSSDNGDHSSCHSSSNRYWQTLEPRIYYLYAPYVRQEHLPLFDTYLPSFNYYQIFRNNRFVGADRVGDAHQLVIGCSSAILDQQGVKHFSLSLGEVLALRRHQLQVRGFSVDPLLDEKLSPLVGSVKWRVNSQIELSADGAWDLRRRRFYNVNNNLKYQWDQRLTVDFWYNYAALSNQRRRFERVNFDRIGGSVVWKINCRWHLLTAMNYNLGYRRLDRYLVGVEYNSCCWAFRIIHTGELEGFAINRKSSYTKGVYLQLMLKGLSSIGAGSFAGSMSSNHSVTGYHTVFNANR